jgi:hypothetical protein
VLGLIPVIARDRDIVVISKMVYRILDIVSAGFEGTDERGAPIGAKM